MARSVGRRRATRVLLTFGALVALMGGAPADAVVDGPCTASFNGVDSDRIDSLASPLELDATDVLTFQGTDEVGTQSARVEVILAMVTVRDDIAVYGPLQNDFSAALDLDEVSPYGVGLYRVRGITDNCIAEAWVRISGRFPFATLTGLTAGGLALGGFAAQMTAIAARRRRSPLMAGIGGIVTGVGAAGIGQQFGRLQLSIPSMAVVAAIAAVLGAVIALLLRPSEGPGWFSTRRDRRARRRAIRYQARLEAARLDAQRREAELEAARVAASQTVAARIPEPDPEPEPDAEPQPRPEPSPRPTTAEQQPKPRREPVPPDRPAVEGPAWCYVLAPVDVFDLDDHSRTVGVLRPGSWYLAKRQVGGWVQVAVGEGIEGWVPHGSIHRHG